MNPFLFALAIQDIISPGPQEPLNLWYLDDGAFMGTPGELDTALSYLVPRLSSAGCDLNRTKTTLWGPAIPSSAVRTQAGPLPSLQNCTVIPFLTQGTGIKLLGCPIRPHGDLGFVRDTLQSVMAQHEQACTQVQLLPDKQI